MEDYFGPDGYSFEEISFPASQRSRTLEVAAPPSRGSRLYRLHTIAAGGRPWQKPRFDSRIQLRPAVLHSFVRTPLLAVHAHNFVPSLTKAFVT